MHGAWHSPNRLTAMIHGQTFQMIALINRSLCILLLVAGWEPSSVQGHESSFEFTQENDHFQ